MKGWDQNIKIMMNGLDGAYVVNNLSMQAKITCVLKRGLRANMKIKKQKD